MIITLSGATEDWIRHNTSWGTEVDQGPDSDRTARAKILEAPHIRRGKGYQIKVELTEPEAGCLWEILDSIAGAGESMTADERGDDAYNYRAIRKDADKIREQS